MMTINTMIATPRRLSTTPTAIATESEGGDSGGGMTITSQILHDNKGGYHMITKWMSHDHKGGCHMIARRMSHDTQGSDSTNSRSWLHRYLILTGFY